MTSNDAGNHTRRNFLKSLCAAAASLSLPATALGRRRSSRKPNVVLIFTDDQGSIDLNCYGAKDLYTDNLDRLAARGTRFTQFYVGAPVCSPSRAALMTGRYSARTGVWATTIGRSLLDRRETTVADVFKASGYRTAMFGKWHLGDNYPYRPQDRGFDHVLAHGGGGVGQAPDFWGNDYFDDTYWHNGTPEKHTGYCTDIWFDGAMRFIEANRNRPFFVYLTTNAPHGPYNVSEKYSGLYKDKNVPNANFYGMITNIDENMGRLLGKLKALGLEENTILIFMTDNGTAAGFRGGKGFNSGMRGTKGSEYEGGHRVPCFVRWPGGALGGGRNVNRLTAHVDLLPTLIDLCGLPGPAQVTFDGTSIAPLLKGAGADWPDRILVTDSQRIEHPEKWRKSAVMTDRWRLINGKELYDLPRDPGQSRDVAAEYPDVVRKLRQAYEKWWESVSQRFDEYCEIVLGSDEENPARLTCHDWHGGGAVPWAQGHIRNGLKANGFWAVEVARAGEYEFSLRRWPREVDAPINAAIPGGKAIRAQQARLQIANVDVSKPIDAQAKEVTFKVSLPAGKTTLRTWFTADDGTSRGAYFAYVKRVS